MKPEDKVVEEVIAYFSEPKFSEFSIITECEIQMGTDNRAADIVLRDANGNFVAIAECKSPGGANYGIPQLKSYISATDTPYGIFAPRIERDSWVFYENLRHNRFQQIVLADFEKGVLKEETEMEDKIVPIEKSSQTKYSNVPIGTANPGCIVILVDQSYSMSEPFDNNSGSKAEKAALAVDRVLENLVLACRTGDEIRDRCHVSVIGYGAQVNCVVDGMISDIAASIVEVKKVKKSIPNGAGGLVEVEDQVPVWLEPLASNGTPMHEAFEQAYEIVERWIADRPDGFPPIIINITDGAASRPDLTADAARKIMGLSTSDGEVLVFNVHIARSGAQAAFSENTTKFTGERLAEFLFSISSTLPQELFISAGEAGFSPQPGARCFVYNAPEVVMIQILQFGSLGITAVHALPSPND